VNGEVDQGLDVRLYPDLVERNGLAQAISHIARESGIDLGDISSEAGAGRYKTAEVASDRGVIQVLLGAESRWFSVTISGQGHVWASGGSVELADIVRVIDSWRRGVGVDDLRSRFPFMELGSLAIEYERGQPVHAQWAKLLADQDLVVIRPLLVAARSNRRLAPLFPYVSHLTRLRLMRDHKDRSAGEIWITQRADELRVEDSRTGSSANALSISEAVTIAASLV